MNAAEKALMRLSLPGAVLARKAGGPHFGVYAAGDRRRRPLAKLSVAEVRTLEAAGAITAHEDGFVITDAGRARARREHAAPGEAYLVQHGAVIERSVIDKHGTLRSARGLQPSSVLHRLIALRDANGAPWLNSGELAAAKRLRAHWETGQAGLVRGTDFAAPPNAKGGRGASSAQEAALAARCDARRKVEEALSRLAPPLRRTVERVCLYEDGVEALERAEGWPMRSGKLALKLGLAQLAASL